MFTFTPILGAAADDDKSLACQSLLTFDSNVRVLIDVGWDDKFSPELLNELERLTPTIDLILLTHATVSHLGAFAYAYKHFPGFDSIPVYATLPVINMGRMVTIDAYATAWFTSRPSEPFQISEVDSIFDKIHTLKYSQQFSLNAKLSSLRISAYNAGHSLGGTIWRLQYGQEDVLHAVDWNHAVERHLNSSLLLTSPESFNRPTALINGARAGSSLRKKEETLANAVARGLAKGGSVLLPTSTTARALELCHFLDAYWTEHKLTEIPLFFVSRTGSRTMSYARSMLEWMSSSIVREWEEKGSETPFVFKYLKVVSSEEEVISVRGRKVIIASGQGLEWGPARNVFAEECSAEGNTVVFTQEVDHESLGGQILNAWKLATDAISDDVKFGRISMQKQLELRRSVPLEGEELQKFLDAERERQAFAERQTAIDIKNRTLLDQEDLSESESSDSEDDEVTVDGVEEKLDVGVLILTQTEDVFDYDVRGAKTLKNKMFPFVPRRIRKDAYGEIIRTEDYLRAEERDEGKLSGKDENDVAWNEEIGKKRKWADDQDEEKVVVIPSKTVVEKRLVTVRCEITFIDFEGLADARSIQMIIPQLQPRKVILISGTTQQSESLSAGLRNAGIEEVYVPEADTSINASMDTSAFEVTISSELAKLIKWQDTAGGEYSVAQIKGKLLRVEQLAKDNSTAAADNADDQTDTNELELLPITTKQEHATAAGLTKPVMVGDVRLAELKRRLISNGHRAEFRGEGMLLCDKQVVVRKLDNNEILVEGGVGKEFYEVRKIVASFLAKIT
ncbi:beta-lactamase-like protein [Lipomyces japonicus]|uniref:beta-lactamase-like protein n=1 Tax=Lipomyces japonicus TaxID=56871 RepID=UPI0034CFAF61